MSTAKKKHKAMVGLPLGNGSEANAIGDVIQQVAYLFSDSQLDDIAFAHALAFALTMHYRVHHPRAPNGDELKLFFATLVDDVWENTAVPLVLPEVSDRPQ